MSFFSKVKKVMSNKKYRLNPIPENLSMSRFVALSVGAINSEQVCYYCDSLVTGEKVKEITDNLKNYYDIENHDSAINTLDWLLNRGHRIYFDTAKMVYAGDGQGIDYSRLSEEEQLSFMEFFMNIQSSLAYLSENGYFENVYEISDISIMAWDMGRLVMVTRSCYDCGYISEIEAWDYIEKAYANCKDIYKDWNDFAKGYIFGRAMWSGANMSLMGIMSIAEGLLSDDDSPWKKVNFK